MVELRQALECLGVVGGVAVIVDHRLLAAGAELPGGHRVLHPEIQLVKGRQELDQPIRTDPLAISIEGCERPELSLRGEPVAASGGLGEAGGAQLDHQGTHRLGVAGQVEGELVACRGPLDQEDLENVVAGRRRRGRLFLPGFDRALDLGAGDLDAELVGPGQQRDGLVRDQRAPSHLARVDLAGAAVDRDPLPGLELSAGDGYLPLGHGNAGSADDRGDAPTASHHGGVAGEPAPGGEDAGGLRHAADVLWGRLGAHQDHGPARVGGDLRRLGRGGDLTGGDAR